MRSCIIGDDDDRSLCRAKPNALLASFGQRTFELALRLLNVSRREATARTLSLKPYRSQSKGAGVPSMLRAGMHIKPSGGRVSDSQDTLECEYDACRSTLDCGREHKRALRRAGDGARGDYPASNGHVRRIWWSAGPGGLPGSRQRAQSRPQVDRRLITSYCGEDVVCQRCCHAGGWSAWNAIVLVTVGQLADESRLGSPTIHVLGGGQANCAARPRQAASSVSP